MVEWSHELCSPAEQALWARMSVFEGGADLDAVEAVCGETGPPTLEVLAGLVDKSVVTVSETGGRVRFRMLETIREYGAERLAERGETDLIRDRHRDHYLALARRVPGGLVRPRPAEWMARVHGRPGQPAWCVRAQPRRPGRPHQRTRAGARRSCGTGRRQVRLDEGSRWFAEALRRSRRAITPPPAGAGGGDRRRSERGDAGHRAAPRATGSRAAPRRHDAADDAAHHVARGAPSASSTGDARHAAARPTRWLSPDTSPPGIC